jgi:hypothetical protein
LQLLEFDQPSESLFVINTQQLAIPTLLKAKLFNEVGNVYNDEFVAILSL